MKHEHEASKAASAARIVDGIVSLEYAKYNYYWEVVTFMRAYQNNSQRKRHWAEAAATTMALRHISNLAAPSYETLRSIYYAIKRVKDDNGMTWEQATIHYTWGAYPSLVKHPARQGTPCLSRRRAGRIERDG
jgi:hypothetical protein